MVLSGKIKEDSGLKPILQMILSRQGAPRSILRILSQQASGRLSIREALFITGAQVTQSAARGHAAIRELLSVQKGLYAYFEPEDSAEFDELNEGLRLPITQLVGGEPLAVFEQLAAEYGFEFHEPQPQPAPEAVLMNFMSSARISWHEIVRHTYSGIPLPPAHDAPSIQAQRGFPGQSALVAPRASLRRVPRITLSVKKEDASTELQPAHAAAGPPDLTKQEAVKFGRRAADKSAAVEAAVPQAVPTEQPTAPLEAAPLVVPPAPHPEPAPVVLPPAPTPEPAPVAVPAAAQLDPQPVAVSPALQPQPAPHMVPPGPPEPPNMFKEFLDAGTVLAGAQIEAEFGRRQLQPMAPQLSPACQFVAPEINQPVEQRFVVTPDLPTKAPVREITHTQPPPAPPPAQAEAFMRAHLADISSVVRRTAQKLKSRILAEAEQTGARRAASQAQLRVSQALHLKNLETQSLETIKIKRRAMPDRATVMGAVIVLALAAGLIVCKWLSDLGSPEEQIRQGQKYLAAGQYDLAATDFSLVLSKQPENLRALCLRGTALARSGQKQAAMEDFNKVIAIAGSKAPVSCLFERAQALFDLGKLSESLAACNALLDAHPNEPDAIALRGMVDARSGQYQKALSELERAPSYMLAEAAIHKGFALWKTKHLDDALKQYEIAAQAYPHNAAILYEKGLVQAEAGRTKEAIADLQQAAQLDHANGGLYVLLGSLLAKVGADEQAINAFEAAIALSHNVRESYMEIARCRFHQGRFADAREALQKCLALNPRDRSALELQAQIAAGKPPRGNTQTVTEANDGAALARLGVASYTAGRFEQAADYLQAAAARGACDNHQRALLARALMKCGKTAAAYQQFMSLALVGALQASDQVAFAECATSESSCDDCVGILESALKSNPDSAPTKLALSSLYKKLGKDR